MTHIKKVNCGYANCGYAICNRLAVGFFRGFAGAGIIALFRGRREVNLRVWRFAIAWRLKDVPQHIKWCFCWPESIVVGRKDY